LLDEFEVKHELAEFFSHVHSMDAGEIRCLEVRLDFPFSMEVEHGLGLS
jgi:hypothetical protein